MVATAKENPSLVFSRSGESRKIAIKVIGQKND